MNEAFLYHVWKYRLFNTTVLQTISGDEVHVLKPENKTLIQVLIFLMHDCALAKLNGQAMLKLTPPVPTGFIMVITPIKHFQKLFCMWFMN